MRPRSTRAWVVGALAALALSACGASTSSASGPRATPLTGTVTVLAAASLTTAFDALGKRFEAAHPGARVTFSYGGSSTLAAQLEQGASADVFASADEPSMDRVVKAGLVSGTPSVFAHNRLAIAVAPGNPRHIAALADLARPGVNVSLCQAQVPCGRYAAQSLDRAGVKVQPASQELDVKAVLSRVELGEADAGIVYASDIHAAGPRVLGVDIPLGQNVLAGYPIAALTGARLDAARLFVEFVLGPEGRRVLTDQRFLVP